MGLNPNPPQVENQEGTGLGLAVVSEVFFAFELACPLLCFSFVVETDTACRLSRP